MKTAPMEIVTEPGPVLKVQPEIAPLPRPMPKDSNKANPGLKFTSSQEPDGTVMEVVPTNPTRVTPSPYARALRHASVAPIAPWSWYGGVDILFLRPYADGPISWVVGGTGFVQGNATVLDLSIQAPRYDFEASPRFWLGYTSPDGLGIRGRYWWYDHNSDPTTFAGMNGGLFTTTMFSSLNLHVADLEVTAQRDCERWWVLGSAGVRYANLNRTGNFRYVDIDGNNISIGTRDIFEGYGVTAGFEAKYTNLCANLRPFFGSRISILGANTTVGTRVVGTPDCGCQYFDINLNQRGERGIVIGELQAGIEWFRAIGCREFFARAGVEGQYWVNGVVSPGLDNLFNANLVIDPANINTLNSTPSNLTFVGLVITLGIRF